MAFKLVMEDREGRRHELGYDPMTSLLTNERGDPALPAPPEKEWSKAEVFSPEAPIVGKSRRVRKLKIQLGLGCNYSCSYCLQREEVAGASKTSTADATRFLYRLDSWLTGEPENIEFWGGEPLLYWHKLAILIPRLRQVYPKATLSIITNGSLFTSEIIDQLIANRMVGAISHDGPGQAVRGPDPLETDARAGFEEAIVRLVKPGHFSLNAVLTPASFNVDKVIDWWWERYGELNVGFEGVVHEYGNDPGSRFTRAQLSTLTQDLALQLIHGTALRSNTIRRKVQAAIDALAQRRPASALGQKCGMDRRDTVACDLNGNVTTCHNTGAESRHRIGHMSRLDHVRLKTGWHWSERQECPTCPVLQLCGGACLYNSGAGWVSACNAEYAYNTGILAGALFYVTGMVLREIRGHHVRPAYDTELRDAPMATQG